MSPAKFLLLKFNNFAIVLFHLLNLHGTVVGEGALGRGRKGRRKRRGEYLGARRTWTIMRAMMRISEEINQ